MPSPTQASAGKVSSALMVLLGVLALSGCNSLPPAAAVPMARVAPGCDDGLKTAFVPDALTTVVAVRAYKQGDKVFVSDSPTPVTLAADLCLVKLKVGPGNPGPADARSTSEGIGIEVWLPTPAAWNQRIRNYGGGGFVGGGHLLATHQGATLETAVGSKFPAPVIAGMGYASGTTDAGQRWSQNGAFSFLPDGKLNVTLLRDFSTRSLYEQAVKTRALVELYYGRAPRYSYFDGHSTGGRQGWKMAQVYPEMYDGYLIAAPAISAGKFGLNSFYPQVVMKRELGFTSDQPQAAAFRTKVDAVNARAVAACDKEGLGFLLDPFSCSYDPLKDAAALCAGELGRGVTGTSTDSRSCLSVREARVVNALWYGFSRDGSDDPNQTPRYRAGASLGPQQLWWSFPRGANWGAILRTVNNAERIATVMQDVRYAPSQAVNPSVDFANASTQVRDKWREIDLPALVEVYRRSEQLEPLLSHPNSDSADLRRLQQLGRKVITYTGLAEDVIPPAGSVNHFERVAAAVGGVEQAQRFLRLYLVPGKAHSSQGRAYVVGSATDPSRNNSVPLPALPGGGNQTPTREQDTFFTALVDWVEKAQAPEDVIVTSRDRSTSYPLCVYPKKITWDGKGSPKAAASYACQP